jgi:outer membrane protein assembly factor BamB
VLVRRALPSLGLACLCWLTAAASAAHAADWTQWRGPNHNGSSPAKNLPAALDPTKAAWRVELPGTGGGTPIVTQGAVFVTAQGEDKRLHALCLDAATGQPRWDKVFDTPGFDTAFENNAASSSPVADAERVAFTFGTGKLYAFNHAGEAQWEVDLTQRYGALQVNFKYSATPLLLGEILYVPILRRNAKSLLVGLDWKTGAERFQVERASDASAESREAYTTPVPHTHQGQTSILVAGGDALSAHAPEDGKERWRWTGYNPNKRKNYRMVTSPVAFENLAYIAGPQKQAPFFALEIPAKDGEAPKVAWEMKRHSPDVCTPLLYEGILYVLNGDKKWLLALDPKTGQEIWNQELPVLGIFRASPVAADGKIFLVNVEGKTLVLEAGRAYKLLHAGALNEPRCWSTPALTEGALYLRTGKALYAFKP